MPAESKCEIIRPLLSEYVDGEISGPEAVRVEGHVDHCPACASHLAFLRAVNFTLSAPPESLPPAAMHARIASLTYARPTLSTRVQTWMRSLTPGRVAVGLGGAAAVALVAAVTLTRPMSVSQEVVGTAPVSDAPAASAQTPDSRRESAPIGSSGSVATVVPQSGVTDEGTPSTDAPGSGGIASATAEETVAAAPSGTGAGAAAGAASAGSGVTSSARQQNGAANRVAVAASETPRPSPLSPLRPGANSSSANRKPSPVAAANGAAPGKQAQKAVAVATRAVKTPGGKSSPGRSSNGGGAAPMPTEIKPLISPPTVPSISDNPVHSIASVAAPQPKIVEPEAATPSATASVVADPVRGDLNDNGRIRLRSTQKAASAGVIAMGNAQPKRGGAYDAAYSATDNPGGTANVVTAPVK